MKKNRFCIIMALLCWAAASFAQSVFTADTRYDEFVRMVSSSGESTEAYDILYRSYEQYMDVLRSAKSGTDDYRKAKAGLKNVFPCLNSGAYYHTGRNDKPKTAQFVEAYIDISVHEAMRGENLQTGSDYATFAWMAATRHYNGKDYAKAVTYLQACINSGDVKIQPDAYNYMAKAYIYLKDYAHARYVLEQGLDKYPDNLGMLTTIINLLGESKIDDVALQKYVSQAFRYKPSDEGLLNIQAQLYERTQNYERAAECYAKLRAVKPQSLDVARHQAVNNYNAAVVYAQKAQADGKKQASEQDRRQASAYFSTAAALLDEVLYNDPLAVDYAYALAHAYAYLGEVAMLQTVNQRLTALGRQAITGTGDMQLMAYAATSARLVAQPAVAQTQTPVQVAQPAPVVESEQSDVSDVDVNIPVNAATNRNTFAVIIANEKYHKVAQVPNAENDGNVFAEYCHKVLGIPKDNIRKYLNVTYGGMLDAIEDIKAIAAAKRGNCDIIFYYAGHGVPDERTKTAYILPVDADGRQMRVCYALSDLYAELTAMNANCITVFLDACFSGATRSEREMLMSARSIAIDVDENEIEGKLVVFSAASGDQSALAYDDQHHGMFTYYLLKKLKETNGNVCLSELGDYITENVTLQARLKNRKEQTPMVVPGNAFGDKWKGVTLK